jgi:Flp pilus assembly protein TadD
MRGRGERRRTGKGAAARRGRGGRAGEPARSAPSGTPAPRPTSLRRLALAAGAVFAGALVLRLLHVAALGREPLAALLLGDAAVYDAWARSLAAGDWIGSGVFYQAPLYPYLLGLWYAVAGPGLGALRIVQAVAGAAACALVALAAARLLGERAGLAAGILAALYAPSLFFDALPQKSALDHLLSAALLFAVALLVERIDARRALAAGLLLGLWATSRENAIALLPVLAVWVALRSRPARAPALLVVLGAAASLAPSALRNWIAGGELHLVTAQAGPNLYIGNHEGATGGYVPLRPGRGNARYERADAVALAEAATGRRLGPREVSAYWRDRALDWIAEHPGRFLALSGRKALLAWNRVEAMDTDDLATHAEWSPPLRWSSRLFHFGLLAPLAVVGLWTARSRWRELWILPAVVAAFTGTLALTYVVARYRHPLVPWLLPFAGAAVVGLPAAWRAASPRARLAGALALAAALLVVGLPLVAEAPMRAEARFNLGRALSDAGRAEEAIAEYRRALELDPRHAAAHNNLGVRLSAAGRRAEAAREFEAAIAADPGLASAHANLGGELAARGEAAAALASFARAVELDPLEASHRFNLGTALAAAGRSDEAQLQLEEAVRLDPREPRAWNNLGIVLASEGRLGEAIGSFEAALRLRPGYSEAAANLARARELLGARGRGSPS